MNMKNFVISLKSASDRREHIINQFEGKGIPFNFFDAIEPSQITSQAEKIGFTIRQGDLTQNELACFLSHFSLWNKIVNENIGYMAIFEDDIYLSDEAGSLLNRVDWIDPNYDVIKIEYFYKKVIKGLLSKKIKDSKSSVFQLKSPNLGAAGYILSYNGAVKCLDLILNNIFVLPLDHVIFDKAIIKNRLNVFQIEPALCAQEMTINPSNIQVKLPSSLCKERSLRMQKNKKKGLSKIYHEILRLFKQVKYVLMSRKVHF